MLHQLLLDSLSCLMPNYESYIAQLPKNYKKFALIGLGKAAVTQTKILHRILTVEGLDFIKGIIISKYSADLLNIKNMMSINSAHPYLEKQSFYAAKILIDFLHSLPLDVLPIFALSGGASTLVAQEQDPFTQEDKILLNNFLLRSGMAIDQINHFRQLTSSIKNSGLLQWINSTDLVTFAISDIPSGNVALIGSGPTYFQSLDIKQIEQEIQQLRFNQQSLELYHIKQKLLDYLHSNYFLEHMRQRQMRAASKKHFFYVVSSYEQFVLCLKERLKRISSVIIETKPLNMDFQSGINWHINFIKRHWGQNIIYVTGGELPVNVQGNGQGGRNSAFVVELGKRLFHDNLLQLSSSQLAKIAIYSLATDGSDGPTGFAGGYLDYQHFMQGRQQGINIQQFIYQDNTLNYLRAIGTAFKTGPTGSNIMDIRLIHLVS